MPCRTDHRRCPQRDRASASGGRGSRGQIQGCAGGDEDGTPPPRHRWGSLLTHVRVGSPSMPTRRRHRGGDGMNAPSGIANCSGFRRPAGSGSYEMVEGVPSTCSLVTTGRTHDVALARQKMKHRHRLCGHFTSRWNRFHHGLGQGDHGRQQRRRLDPWLKRPPSGRWLRQRPDSKGVRQRRDLLPWPAGRRQWKNLDTGEPHRTSL